MRQITVRLDDDEAAKVEAAARACGIDTANLTKTELVLLLASTGIAAAMAPGSVCTDEAVCCNSHETNEEAARLERLAALIPSQGLWKNDPDKPKDGLVYQNEVRAEWR